MPRHFDERALAVLRFVDVEARVLEQAAQHETDVRFVVDDEDARVRHGLPMRCARKGADARGLPSSFAARAMGSTSSARAPPRVRG